MSCKKLHCNHSQKDYEYQVVHGFDLARILQADKDWGAEKDKIIGKILSVYPKAATEIDVLWQAAQEFNIEDWGWEWMRKAMVCRPPRYDWFFLVSDGKTQGIAIIYHPEPSQLQSDNIFYVDYLATAFWNRNRPGYKKRFSQVGTILLAHSINYAIANLKLRPGFSLHSLPGAEEYYLSLGMSDLGIDPNKEDLRRFEAPETVAKEIMEASLG